MRPACSFLRNLLTFGQRTFALIAPTSRAGGCDFHPQTSENTALSPDFLGFGIGFMFALGFGSLLWGFAIDDVWICLRYAENIAHGLGHRSAVRAW